MEEAVEILNEFISNYLQLGEENINTFKIERLDINDINFFTNFCSSIKRLYEYYPLIELELHCDFVKEEYDFWLLTKVDIKNSIVTFIKFEIEPEQAIENIFADESLVVNLNNWYSNYVNSRTCNEEDLIKLLEACVTSEEIYDIKMTFSFEKNSLLSKLPCDKFKDINVCFFLSYENFKKYACEISSFKFRDTFLENKNATLFLINGTSSSCYGNYLGIFDLKESINEPQKLEAFLINIKNDLQERYIQITSMISATNPSYFIPPQFFNIIEKCDEAIVSLFYPWLLFNLYISFSDFVESDGKNYCICRINGNRIVYSKLSIYTENLSQFKIDEQLIEYELYSKLIDELYEFYLRIYGETNTGVLDETKIFLSKKVISTYSKNFVDFLNNIEDIKNSTYADHRLYIQEKVDKFISFKEQLINYTFNYNKDVVKFNSTLSEKLNDSLFKIIGLALVFLIGLLAKSNENFGEKYLLLGPLLLILYIIFSIYQLRNIKDLYKEQEKQHESSLKYFQNFLEEKDIKSLSQTIDNTVFEGYYSTANKVLWTIAILCFIIWIFWIYFNIDTLVNIWGEIGNHSIDLLDVF